MHLFDHNVMKLEVNHKKKCYYTKLGQPKNKKRNKKVHGSTWKWKHNKAKPLGCSKSGSKKEVYSNTALPQEARELSNTQPNLAHKGARKRTTNKTWNKQKVGNNKDYSRNKWYRN